MSEYSAEIKKLLEEGAKSYAAKNYEVAVEHYGEACGLYSQHHDGEEDPELLFLYGQALFHVAVSRNGLFGGNAEEATSNAQVTTEEEEPTEPKPNDGMFTFSEDVPLAEEEDDSDDEDKNPETEQQEEEEEEGEEDENEQNEDGEGGQQEEQQEEEQSDFEIAWEILDLARTLLESKLSDEKHEIPENAAESTDPTIKAKVKISEIYDLLGEISLETENFKQASEDFESLLKIRETIYPFESNLISEAHYKLSLSLELNFENEDAKPKATAHLKKAIESMKQSKNDKKADLIKELELKLQEMQRDPSEILQQQKEEIMKGLMGQATGGSSSATKIASASSAPVNDLTSIVKKRKAKPADAATKKAKN